jgi:hypothetical protein
LQSAGSVVHLRVSRWLEPMVGLAVQLLGPGAEVRLCGRG